MRYRRRSKSYSYPRRGRAGRRTTVRRRRVGSRM